MVCAAAVLRRALDRATCIGTAGNVTFTGGGNDSNPGDDGNDLLRGVDGSDNLANIEHLQFADRIVAFA